MYILSANVIESLFTDKIYKIYIHYYILWKNENVSSRDDIKFDKSILWKTFYTMDKQFFPAQNMSTLISIWLS